MNSVLEIDGKNLLPIKEAVKEVSYSRDYITRLARDKKITAVYVGRQWFVCLESLKNYVELISYEQEVRNRQLSEERINEAQLRKTIDEQDLSCLDKVRMIKVKAVSGALAVLCFGLLSGFSFYNATNFSQSNTVYQVASTFDTNSVSEPVFFAEDSVEKTEQLNSSLNEVEAEGEFAPKFSRVVESLPTSKGVLLFPNERVENFSGEELFSDEVVIKTADNGSQSAVIVDEFGDEVGREIPLVIIPVKTEEKNL